MPSQVALPSIADHLQIGKRAIVINDIFSDDRSGGVYDFLMGTAALAWSREAAADQDKFRAIYLSTATGDDLTDFVLQRFGIQRVLDTYGQGVATFIRPSALAGAGTIYAGTQIQISDSSGGATVYAVVADVAVGASQLVVPQVAIQATSYGLGVAINNASGPIVDPLWDNGFFAVGVFCANGTVYESAPDFRARVTQTLLNQRPGYPALIVQTLQNAGAQQILLFPSNYQGVDHGVNCIYVGDAGFSTSQALLIACRAAVESCRVLGPDLQIQGMTNASIAMALTVALWDDPSKFDTTTLSAIVTAGVIQYFTNLQNAFAYKIDGIRGAAARVSKAIQLVTVTLLPPGTPNVDQTLSSSNWPAVLTRYMPSFTTIQVAFTGPT